MYSEIEGVDALYTSLTYKMLRTLYKGSGYDAYIGGALKNLRDNTTHQMVIEINDKYSGTQLKLNIF